MKVVIYTDEGKTNFGDDLNRWVWRRLLGATLDADDGVLLAGIGTVISKGLLPPNQRYIVLGSGVGYDTLPEDVGGASWKILAVRGPLTASILGLPAEKAATDAAALIGLLPECEPLPESERSGIAFMPHYSTLAHGHWKEVCASAGLIYLDPFADSEKTVQRIRRARLVIADAMHAAIVADALRVPWIPVALSPQNNTFKWLDWTLSLDLPYAPAYIGASTAVEALCNFSCRFRGIRYYSTKRDRTHILRMFLREQRRRSSRQGRAWSQVMFLLTLRLPQRILECKLFRGMLQPVDRWHTRRAARALRQATTRPSNLSGETVFHAKLQQLLSCLRQLGNRSADVEPVQHS